MGRKVITLLAIVALPALAAAQVLEDFEHGNMGLYTITNGTNNNMSIVPQAAHDGNLGAMYTSGAGPMWYLRSDVPTSAGNVYYGYFKFGPSGSVGSGRIYMGVNGSMSGAISAVAASNTSQLLIQNNTGWGYTTLASVAYTFTIDKWYVLEMDWAANGDMVARLWDEAYANKLAETPVAATGQTGAGGLALRCYMATSGATAYFDTFSRVPEPASLLSLLALSLVVRRR